MSNVKTRAQIAREFGISRKTLYNWLKEEKLPIKGRLLSPKEQKEIYEKFGAPENLPKKWRS
ncbi:MAG: helix-turn-helix domain-containing protein [Phaeodactylibacter sp.]|nr:helix-turn-helix domain-containing protein [Phaeodactylibacter sp.]